MIDDANQISEGWLKNKTKVGVTAGASAPEILVRRVVERLNSLTDASVSELVGVKENITFAVPKELRS